MGVSVGRGVSVGGMSEVSVGVGVNVGTRVDVEVGRGVGLPTSFCSTSGVLVGVGGAGVFVGDGVLVEVAVLVAVGTLVGLGVLVGVGNPFAQGPWLKLNCPLQLESMVAVASVTVDVRLSVVR